MTYLLWYFIVVALAEAVYMIALVGRHRKPVTPADAIATLIVAAAHVLAYAWILGRVS